MNILLDAFYDRNFGDDIFIEYILKLFPNHKFYSYLEFYPQEIRDWAEIHSNLYILPECSVLLKKNMFDAYICIGGDIFPDKGDYAKRKAYIESVRQVGGVIAFIGFSLFHSYSNKTEQDIREMMENADIIAPRDEMSAELLRRILNDEKIKPMADLAFSDQWSGEKEASTCSILGISVRRPGYASDEEMNKYCQYMAEIVKYYLEINSEGSVKIFSLSDGASSDREVAEDIIKRLPDKSRVEHIAYNGDTCAIKKEIYKCNIVLCTRLHAMIACIAMNIAFIPIIYEVKMEHILEEIDYKGPMPEFPDMKGLREQLNRLLNHENEFDLWCEDTKQSYLALSAEVLSRLSDLLYKMNSLKIDKADRTGSECAEKEYGKQQAQMVAQKNAELEKMAEDNLKYQEIIEQCQKTISQYLFTIEECNKTNSQYFKLIEELNGNINSLQSENNRMSNIISSVEEEIKYKNNLLNLIQPYFTTASGNKITKIMSMTMKKNNDEAENNWKVIQQYYQSPDSGAEDK